MTNNFEIIRTLLDFSEKNSFYFAQVLKRRKENPDMKTGTSVIDNFYIYDEADFDKLQERIIDRCTKHNARAYINLNRLDTEKIALYTQKLMIDYIIQKDFKSVKNAYATTCGSHHSEKEKRWVVDIDAEQLHRKDEIRAVIELLHKEIPKNDYKILAEIPTRTGVHIISNPFNLEKFRKIVPDVECHKNSPTILYIS